MKRAEVTIALAPEDAQRRGDGAPARCQDHAGKQHQDVRPARRRKQIGEHCEAGDKAPRQRRTGRTRKRMGMSHPIRRINALNRGNLAAPRQIESATSSALSRTGLIVHTDLYVQTRPDQVRPDAGPDRESVQRARRGKERRRIPDHRSRQCKPSGKAAADPKYRSLRTVILVESKRSMENLRPSRPHETHAGKRS